MSDFLHRHLQEVMKGGKSYVKGTNHFWEKLKELGKVSPNAILVTADVVGLYPSIPHDSGLKALYEKLEERNDKSVPTADLVNMADFVLKSNYFEFDSCIKQQISGTTIGTKFALPYACIFMDKVESAFLESENTKYMGMDEVHGLHFFRLNWKWRWNWRFLATSKSFPSYK